MTKAEHAKDYANHEQAKLDAFVRRLPPMLVTLQELEELPEYSGSYPTGTRPGKLWRTELNAYDRLFHLGGGKTRWVIRQYDPDCPPEAKEIKFRPVIRVKAGSYVS